MERKRLLCRKFNIRHALVVFCLLAIPHGVVSREYRCRMLQTAATKLNMEQQIDNAFAGTTSTVTLASGQAVAVRIGADGEVEHIGLPLFSDMMRQQKPSPIYDCIEYAALDRSLIHSENDLLLQKILLLNGTWQTVCNIQPTDECSISLRDNKAWQVIWRRDGSEIINMAVPVDYELLSLSSRRELEQHFVRNMASHPDNVKSDFFLSSAPQLANATIHLEMLLSNYSQQTTDISVRQWVAYCESQGCTSYYINDDTEDAVARGYLHMRNEVVGYHHLLEFSCPVEELNSAQPKLRGKAHLFIPNINGEGMYGSEDNIKANKKLIR